MKIRNNSWKCGAILAGIVCICSIVGFCSAYFVDYESKQTTFVSGHIDIKLTESDDLDLIMVPGKEIYKDPAVLVEAGSSDSFVFIKVEDIHNAGTFFTYEIDETWKLLDGYGNIYYTVAEGITTDKVFPVLKDNKVIVKEDVKKEFLASLKKESYPELYFSAYAIQKGGIPDPVTAWQTLMNSEK